MYNSAETKTHYTECLLFDIQGYINVMPGTAAECFNQQKSVYSMINYLSNMSKLEWEQFDQVSAFGANIELIRYWSEVPVPLKIP